MKNKQKKKKTNRRRRKRRKEEVAEVEVVEEENDEEEVVEKEEIPLLTGVILHQSFTRPRQAPLEQETRLSVQYSNFYRHDQETTFFSSRFLPNQPNETLPR